MKNYVLQIKIKWRISITEKTNVKANFSLIEATACFKEKQLQIQTLQHPFNHYICVTRSHKSKAVNISNPPCVIVLNYTSLYLPESCTIKFSDPIWDEKNFSSGKSKNMTSLSVRPSFLFFIQPQQRFIIILSGWG